MSNTLASIVAELWQKNPDTLCDEITMLQRKAIQGIGYEIALNHSVQNWKCTLHESGFLLSGKDIQYILKFSFPNGFSHRFLMELFDEHCNVTLSKWDYDFWDKIGWQDRINGEGIDYIETLIQAIIEPYIPLER